MRLVESVPRIFTYARLRSTGLGLLATLAVAVSASAGPIPLATVDTGNCTTSSTPTSSTCSQTGGPGVSIFAEARLTDLTATARVDTNNLYAFVASAELFYFGEVFSSTGVYAFQIPLLVKANGHAETAGAPTGTFNHDVANASVSFNFRTIGSACSGFGCRPGDTTDFAGPVPVLVVTNGISPSIFQIAVQASVETNSDYLVHYAFAWADPLVEIDPTFLAANPQYSLNFSANVPVPEPTTMWMIGSGLLGIMRFARRRQ